MKPGFCPEVNKTPNVIEGPIETRFPGKFPLTSVNSGPAWLLQQSEISGIWYDSQCKEKYNSDYISSSCLLSCIYYPGKVALANKTGDEFS